jgi:hypothetical protein
MGIRRIHCDRRLVRGIAGYIESQLIYVDLNAVEDGLGRLKRYEQTKEG